VGRATADPSPPMPTQTGLAIDKEGLTTARESLGVDQETLGFARRSPRPHRATTQSV